MSKKAEYEVSIPYDSDVIANVKVFSVNLPKTINRQTHRKDKNYMSPNSIPGYNNKMCFETQMP